LKKRDVQVLKGMLIQRLKVDPSSVFEAMSGGKALEFLLSRMTPQKRCVVRENLVVSVCLAEFGQNVFVMMDIQMPCVDGNKTCALW
jgi:CheY-like chemotaxis protein